MNNLTESVNVLDEVAEAAQKAGAVCPEGVAEYLKDDLTVVDTASGPQVVVRNGLDVESLDGVFARMRVTDNVGALFHGGNVSMRTMDQELYRIIRKHKPEWVGLRRRR